MLEKILIFLISTIKFLLNNFTMNVISLLLIINSMEIKNKKILILTKSAYSGKIYSNVSYFIAFSRSIVKSSESSNK